MRQTFHILMRHQLDVSNAPKCFNKSGTAAPRDGLGRKHGLLAAIPLKRYPWLSRNSSIIGRGAAPGCAVIQCRFAEEAVSKKPLRPPSSSTDQTGYQNEDRAINEEGGSQRLCAANPQIFENKLQTPQSGSCIGHPHKLKPLPARTNEGQQKRGRARHQGANDGQVRE